MILLMEVWETAGICFLLRHDFRVTNSWVHGFHAMILLMEHFNISLLCQMHPLPHLLRICASIFAALCVLGGFHFYLVPGRYRYGFNMIQLQHARGWCFSTQRVHGWFKRISRKGRSYFSYTFAETSCVIFEGEYVWTYLMGGYLNHRNMTCWDQKDCSIHVSLRIHLLGLWLFAPWTQILTNQTTIEFQLNIVRRRQCRRNGELLGRELQKGWLDVRSSKYWYQKDLKCPCNSIPVSWIGITPTSLKPVSVYCEKLGATQVPAVCR